jgi:Zn-dependent M16 (insulinase) family peptidase
LRLLTRQLSYGFLWEEIRAKKGAYGANAFMSSSTGTFFLTSFRDPEIASTFDTFGKLFDYIEKEMDLSDGAVSSAVISTIKELDPPQRPATAIRTALFRHLIGMGRSEINEFRERLLSLKAADIVRASTEILRPSWERSSLCVISSREKLEEASRHFPTGMEITDLDW